MQWLGWAIPANAADTPPQSVDWPAYNNDMLGQRYSPLKQINAGNVASLHEVCRVKVQDGGSFHTGPIVVDGTMYVTTARDTVALDPRTCKEIWRHTYRSSIEDVWPVNRGVAYLNGRLFRGTANGRSCCLIQKCSRDAERCRSQMHPGFIARLSLPNHPVSPMMLFRTCRSARWPTRPLELAGG